MLRGPKGSPPCMPAHLDNVVNPGAQARNINDTEKMFEKHKSRMCLRVDEDLNFVNNPSFYLFLYSINIFRLPVCEHSKGHGPGMATKMRRYQKPSCWE